MVDTDKSATVYELFNEDPELFLELNSKPARVTINGKRHYETPFHTGPAASVTTIISETASEANKKKLEMWAKSNPGMKEAAAERGTAIHSCMEMFLKKEDVDVPLEYQEFWTGMPEILEQFDEVLWAETPLRDDHRFALSEDGIGRVWGRDEEERPWVGSPDIIGIAGGSFVMCQYWSSQMLTKQFGWYCQCSCGKMGQSWCAQGQPFRAHEENRMFCKQQFPSQNHLCIAC